MPLTRSQAEEQRTPATSEDTSEYTASTATDTSATSKATEESVEAPAQRRPAPTPPPEASSKPRAAPSKKASTSASRRAAQLRKAREELLQLRVELAEAKIANMEAESDTEDDLDTLIEGQECEERIGEWVESTSNLLAIENDPRSTAAQPQQQQRRAPEEPNPPIEEAKIEELPTPMGDCKTQGDRKIDLSDLAAAITQAARSGHSIARSELPYFDGSHHEWLPFRAAYFESQATFTNTENLARLRRSLKGKAKEAVESLLIYTADARIVLKTLEARFGRPDSIAIAELEKVRALPRINDNARDICILATKLTNTVATLRALQRQHYLYSPETVRCTIDKLTPVLKYKWYDYAIERPVDEPDLVKLSRFLEREAERCGPYASLEPTINDKPTTRRPQRAFTASNKKTSDTRNSCAVCDSESHNITKCPEYQRMSIEQRWDTAKDKRLCFACLRFRSQAHRCTRKKCETNGCEKTHHTLLHYEKKANSTTEKNETVASTWAPKNMSYLKMVPIHIAGPAGAVDAHALLDDGSTVTLIDAEIAKKTGARGPQDPLHIESIGDQRVTSPRSRRVTLTLRGATKTPYEIRARTIGNLQLSSQAVTADDLAGCDHLHDIQDQLMYPEAKPQVLIGQDNWHLLLATEVRKGQLHQPVASLTPLGWVLHGAHTRTMGRGMDTVNFIHTDEDCDMNDQLRSYIALDSLLIEPKLPQSDPDQRALLQLQQGVRREKDGRYQAPLLWKRPDSSMPDNYENTLKRLHNIEKKIDRDPELKKQYEEHMSSLLTKGYAEVAPKEKDAKRTWYLPHFAVVNAMKPGKIRIVHDAAAKTKGLSLNDYLLRGPDLLQSLPGVIMRFRQHSIAVSADIKEMFMQVKVRPEDRDALRYLWRGERRDDKPPEEYRMTSLIFGATCSPSVAIYVKDINAHSGDHSTEAQSAVVRSHYVDDYIHSSKTIEEAVAIATEVRDIHRGAHYELRQWTSNSQEVLDALQPGATPTCEVDFDDEKTERVLGIVWKPRTDELTFNLNLARLPPGLLEKKRPTKRETLKILMSIFDPLGLASPVTIRAKQILQEIWRRGTDWDEPIDDDLAQKWEAWTAHLKNLGNIAIPRCYLKYSDAAALQLHVFVDASESAYAAALYWRAVTPDGQGHVSLIAAKAKVAPLKLTSIPRLELQAAVLGSRMAAAVIEAHDTKPLSCTYWTDSKTVLTWLSTGSRSYRPFVAHRIAAIEENCSLHEWRWVPTKLNVADDATRDVPLDFSSSHRWYTGPSFLSDDHTTWPSGRPTLHTPTGEEKTLTLTETEKIVSTEEKTKKIEKPSLATALPDFNRFSQWERLVRTTARVLQFIELCRRKIEKTTYARTKANKKTDPTWGKKKEEAASARKKIEQTTDRYRKISAQLLIQAENLIVTALQQSCFTSEIADLSKNRRVNSGSQLRKIAVEIVNGVIVLKSRIDAAQDVPDAVKRPPVLDGRHHVCRLYIAHVHRSGHHQGVEATINQCRQKFHMLGLRPTARSVIHACVTCRRRRWTPPAPPTGNHPASRLTHHQRAFTCTGIDYFGPLPTTFGRGTRKSYVALFTCLTTRAVHLELTNSLTTDSAVMALRRFIARRGCPREIWSDNGTNLHGAEKVLREAVDGATEAEAAKRRVQWRFIPPGAPFMGGAWERLVRSVKNALNTVLSARAPTEEVLATLLAEVEMTVNSRPLTHVSVDPEDPQALTPNHFLLLGPALEPSMGESTPQDACGRNQWKKANALADMYWSRWLREYLPELQYRREPHGKGRALQIDDIVVVVDNTLPRNTWPMGKIVATYPGPDGVVRTADVQTRGGVLRRPTKKLVILCSRVPESPVQPAE